MKLLVSLALVCVACTSDVGNWKVTEQYDAMTDANGSVMRLSSTPSGATLTFICVDTTLRFAIGVDTARYGIQWPPDWPDHMNASIRFDEGKVRGPNAYTAFYDATGYAIAWPEENVGPLSRSLEGVKTFTVRIASPITRYSYSPETYQWKHLKGLKNALEQVHNCQPKPKKEGKQ